MKFIGPVGFASARWKRPPADAPANSDRGVLPADDFFGDEVDSIGKIGRSGCRSVTWSIRLTKSSGESAER